MSRVAELEGELSRIRELVVLLGKAMGRLPGGQQLPGHDDPVWLQLGPLGGVSFALDTVIKHTRVSAAVRSDVLQLRLSTGRERGIPCSWGLYMYASCLMCGHAHKHGRHTVLPGVLREGATG